MPPDPALESLLIAKGLIASGQMWHPMQGGRTNQLWHVGGAVVKRYAPGDGNPRFPNDPAQEAAILHHLQGQCIAPRLLGQVARNGVTYLVYQHLEGALWQTDPGQVGRLLRRLHMITAPQDLRALPGGSEAIDRQVSAILPDLPRPLAAQLLARRPSGQVAPSRGHALLHGDAVPGNIVVTPQGARLIDWQCPAQGDPVEDLAIFLSPAMQLIYRGAPLSETEINEFLAAYDDPTTLTRVRQMQPWHHWAMAAYCGWKSARGAAEYDAALHLELAAL